MEQLPKYDLVCRTCLKETEGELTIPIAEIYDFLMSYTSIKVTECDGLPTSVCESCHLQAIHSYQFILLCEESDYKLKNKSYLTDITESKNNDNLITAKLDNEQFSDWCSNTSAVDEKPNMQLNLLEEHVDLEDKCDIIENNTCPTSSDSNNTVEKNNLKTSVPVKAAVKKKKSHTCHVCRLKFTSSDLLSDHVETHGNAVLKCCTCDKTFGSMKKLRVHIHIHKRKGAHLCQICGKQFTLPENLLRHQRIHTGIRPYKCNMCDKSFTQSNELKSHIITHTTEKPHLCNVCGNKYARSVSLRVHIRRLHSEASNLRPYQCKLCMRKYKDKRDLAQHISIHKDERKHVCQECGKRFNRRSNLKVHSQIHSGYRPFVCTICQKSFIQKHVLNTHLKIHSKDTDNVKMSGEEYVD